MTICLVTLLKSVRAFFLLISQTHVEFSRRQANEIVHNLSRVTILLTSFYIFPDIPTCIQDLVGNEMP
jgi:hypothetical protein